MREGRLRWIIMGGLVLVTFLSFLAPIHYLDHPQDGKHHDNHPLKKLQTLEPPPTRQRERLKQEVQPRTTVHKPKVQSVSSMKNADNNQHKQKDLEHVTTEIDRLSGSSNSTMSTTATCLTMECIQTVARRLAWAFPDRYDREWVIHDTVPDIGNYTACGIILVKNFKAASSTAAGIAERLAMKYGYHYHHNPHHASRHNKTPQVLTKRATVRTHHTRAWHYQNHHPQKTLLFTSVREPASRAISRIFYTSISQMRESPTDETILSKLRWTNLQFGAVSHSGGGYQVRYLSMQKQLEISWDPATPHLVLNPTQIEQYVHDILRVYDFVLVAERMDESVVAMAMVWNVTLEDVLVQDSKVSGSWVYYSTSRKNQGRVERCTRSVPSFTSPAVQAHLESPEWISKNYGDYLLHQAAVMSLDQTIARLGKEPFTIKLQEYRALKQQARLLCANQTFGHCSANGTIQKHISHVNCYSDDNGCGYQCIDEMLKNI